LNQNFDHNISFKDISFKYENDIALKNINLTIRKGEKVVIVGESGSGKSTLVELLLKFYDPLSGEIHIDNNNINRINIKPLFTLITQNVMLFNDTIINNLNVGNENASLEEIKYATQQAYISSVIEKLPNKYETIIGPQGNNLSGGERQRIAIARALLSKAPILIFDEPTSSLDSESNNLIQETFNTLESDKTIIMITHKLQFLEEYDRIIVMKNGEIVEQGKHQFLLNKDGVYKKLYEIENLNSNEKN